jgi:acyl carrier protein
MTVSSRTPEGSPSRCLVCASEVRIEPSRPFGDAPCPACGTLLWFVAIGSEARLFDPIQDERVHRFAERLGLSPDDLQAGRWRDLGIDSLDMVELIMELEEELDIQSR